MVDKLFTTIARAIKGLARGVKNLCVQLGQLVSAAMLDGADISLKKFNAIEKIPQRPMPAMAYASQRVASAQKKVKIVEKFKKFYERNKESFAQQEENLQALHFMIGSIREEMESILRLPFGYQIVTSGSQDDGDAGMFLGKILPSTLNSREWYSALLGVSLGQIPSSLETLFDDADETSANITHAREMLEAIVSNDDIYATVTDFLGMAVREYGRMAQLEGCDDLNRLHSIHRAYDCALLLSGIVINRAQHNPMKAEKDGKKANEAMSYVDDLDRQVGTGAGKRIKIGSDEDKVNLVKSICASQQIAQAVKPVWADRSNAATDH
jgi:hypothetical protein